MSIKYFYKNTAEFNKIDQWVNTGDWGALLLTKLSGKTEPMYLL